VEAGAHEYAILYRSRSMVEDLDDRTPARGLGSERDLSWHCRGALRSFASFVSAGMRVIAASQLISRWICLRKGLVTMMRGR